jgi:phosphatidylglycerophosphate synthase
MGGGNLLLEASIRFVILGAALAAAAAPLGWAGTSLALLIFAAVAAGALAGLGHHPHRQFGAANAVTAGRAAAVALLFGIWAEAALGRIALAPLGWTVVALAGAAIVSDGVDGWLARRTRLASGFGARFDMETDALLVLVLALLVYQSGRAGAFVLLGGALGYLFVAAGWMQPALGAPLPPSWRRKAVCVVHTMLTIAALAPPVPPALAQALATLGVLLLVLSFAIDCRGRLLPARG